jgi:inosose dehydratase
MDKGRVGVVNGISVGTASVNWGFDPLYTWVATPSFERMLDEMVQAGYGATEISYNFPDDLEVVAGEMQRRQLRASATFHAVNVRDRANHATALESSMRTAKRLRQLGGDVLILSDAPSPPRLKAAGHVGREDKLSDTSWSSMADGFKSIADAVASVGISAAFHPHVGTYVETRDEIDRLCELTEASPIALCPDTGHLAYAGVDPECLFADYLKRIGYVHLKDVNPAVLERVRQEHIDFVAAVRRGMFVELGRGMVSIERIIALLRQADYGGWLVVEQDAPPNPFIAAKANRDYLRENFGL